MDICSESFLAIINVLAMCDFNLHFSVGFSHANICVGATDVWESIFKVRRMIFAVQCFITASVAQWCVT